MLDIPASNVASLAGAGTRVYRTSSKGRAGKSVVSGADASQRSLPLIQVS